MKRIRCDCNDGDSHLAVHFGCENLAGCGILYVVDFAACGHCGRKSGLNFLQSVSRLKSTRECMGSTVIGHLSIHLRKTLLGGITIHK